MKKINVTVAFAALCAAVLATEARADQLTDPQIAKIVEASDMLEIRAGEVARSQAASKDVKDFANDMVKVHQDNRKETKNLTGKLKISPKDSDASKQMQKDGDAKIADLKNLHGKDFDKAYINSQVDMHKQVLDTIDNQLLPNAKDPQLKAMLEKTRPVVAEHLAHAEHLQQTLMK